MATVIVISKFQDCPKSRVAGTSLFI